MWFVGVGHGKIQTKIQIQVLFSRVFFQSFTPHHTTTPSNNLDTQTAIKRIKSKNKNKKKMVKTFETKETFIKSKNRLAEGPTYDTRIDHLFWVDITGRQINWISYTNPDTIFRVNVNHPIGVIALTSTPKKLLVGAKLGFGLIDLTDAKGDAENVQVKYIHKIHTSSEDSEKMRFNDGYVDAKGRFYAGSMADLGFPETPIGKLYCFDYSKNSVEVVETGLTIPNGMGWSPDNKIMYHTDSPTSTIYKYDYDLETGKATNRSVFVKVEFPGLETPEPDGLTITTDGSVWTAIYNSATVRRYSPEGEVLEEYKFPTKFVTCPTFVGEGLNELVVTSMSAYNGSPDYEKLKKTEVGEGGNIFRIEVDRSIRGIPRNIVSI